MGWLRRRWRYVGLTLLPLLLALLHATGWLHMPALQRLDDRTYDLNLRATMPRTQDPRIVVIDIDERSLQAIGHWPWRRDLLAQLAHELLQRQQVAVLGFDVLFDVHARPSASACICSRSLIFSMTDRWPPA